MFKIILEFDTKEDADKYFNGNSYKRIKGIEGIQKEYPSPKLTVNETRILNGHKPHEGLDFIIGEKK